MQAAVKALGGKVEPFYYAFGDDDAGTILELPNNTAAAALGLSISGSGAVRARTTPLLSVEEIDQALELKTHYRAPGGSLRGRIRSARFYEREIRRARRNDPTPKAPMIRMNRAESTRLKRPVPRSSNSRHACQARGMGSSAKARKTKPMTWFHRMRRGRITPGTTCWMNFRTAAAIL